MLQAPTRCSFIPLAKYAYTGDYDVKPVSLVRVRGLGLMPYFAKIAYQYWAFAGQAIVPK